MRLLPLLLILFASLDAGSVREIIVHCQQEISHLNYLRREMRPLHDRIEGKIEAYEEIISYLESYSE